MDAESRMRQKLQRRSFSMKKLNGRESLFLHKLLEIYWPGKVQKAAYVGDQQLFFQADEGPSRLLSVPGQILAGGSIPILSPDGRHIAMPLQVADIPAEWLEYLEPHIHELARRKLGPGNTLGYTDMYLIDVTTGDNRVLLDAPILDGWGTNLAWSPDSHSVVITNAHLPLTGFVWRGTPSEAIKDFHIRGQDPEWQGYTNQPMRR